MEYYLGQYKWISNPGRISYWEAPVLDGLSGNIDLRTIDQMSQIGGVPEGYAIFEYKDFVNDPALIPISSNKDDLFDTTNKDLISNTLKIDIGDVTLTDLIWNLLGENNDSSLICPVALPKSNGVYEVIIGDTVIRSEKIIPSTSPQWSKILARIQEDYLAIRDTYTNKDISKKFLGYLEEQYKIDYKTFIPAGEPIVDKIPPTTTITESFNKADNGLGPDLSWIVDAGSFGVTSNQGSLIGTTAYHVARADSALSSDNHYAQCVLKNVGINAVVEADWGPMARKIASSTLTFYTCHYIDSAASDTFRTSKMVSGTQTNIGTNTVTAAVADDLLKIECNGSTITRYRNGLSQNAATDTSITGNLITGLSFYKETLATAPLVDDFEAADLGVSITINGRMMLLGMGS